jgi:hypothetical protein
MRYFFTAIIAALISTPALATGYLSLHVGSIGVFNAKSSAVYGLEYRSEKIYDDFLIIAGGLYSDNEDKYGYVGLQYDYEPFENIYFTPSTSVGIYGNPPGEKGLGGPIALRSGVEIAYQFENNVRAGVTLTHISNAYIYESNPGTETLTFTVSVPLP